MSSQSRHNTLIRLQETEREVSFDTGKEESLCRYHDLTVIIPTLNEAGNIAALLEELLSLYPGLSCVVVDDASEDETRSIVRRLMEVHKKVYLLERNAKSDRGLTASVLEGIQHCRTPYFMVMDGDFQHPPSLIAECHKVLQSGADLVIATRRTIPENYSVVRRLVSTAATKLAQMRLSAFRKRRAALGLAHKREARTSEHAVDGVVFSAIDPLSGFFGGATSRFAPFIQNYRQTFVLGGYKLLFDFLKIFAAEGFDLRVQEVPFDFANRAQGNSKLRFIHMARFCRALFRPVLAHPASK